jgi:hypothetical protein
MKTSEIRAKQNIKLRQLKNNTKTALARKYGTMVTKTDAGYTVSGYEWRGEFFPVAIVPMSKLTDAIKAVL